jgi:hypothetical protein
MQTKEFMFSGVRMNGFLMLFLVLLLLAGIVLLYFTEEGLGHCDGECLGGRVDYPAGGVSPSWNPTRRW